MLLTKLKEAFKEDKKIAVLHLNGVIGSEQTSIMKSKNFSTKNFLKQLENIIDEKKYHGILLRINSPGGSAGSSEEIAQMLRKVRTLNIPIVSSIGDICASGAYMIAAQSHYIFAGKMSLVGSIGVIMQIPNFTGLSEKIGISENTIKAGSMKDVGNPFREMTAKEKEYLEDLVQKSHKEFIKMITLYREIKNIPEMTDGRILDAQDALDNGLIDSFGTYYDALDYLITKLNTDKNHVEINEMVPHKSFIQKLFNEF